MLGTALTTYALSEGVAVTALVRPGSGKLSAMRHPLLTVAQCDLSALEQFEGEPCDAFVHLGWGATFGAAREDIAVQVKNIEYTLSAVRLAKKLGCTSFVFVGSQAEYGKCDAPLTPDTPTRPETGYGTAKLAAGQCSRLLCAQLGIRHCHVRVLSVYGGHDRDGTLVSTCVDAMLRGESVALTPCTQMWDYLYEDDAARALFLTAERGADGAVYVLGSGECQPLKAYVAQIREATACAAEPQFGARDFNPHQVHYLCADISALTNDTGFVPQVSFAEGIRRTIKERREKR